MKIAYIGIDFLKAALEELLLQGCEVMEIFSCRTDNKTEFNTWIAAKAQELYVPFRLEPIELQDLKRLKEQGCEAVFCAGYYHRIPILPGFPMVNVHPAALPLGSGAWPMPVTILKGLKESGVTLHKLTEGMDMGDILAQKVFAVSEQENLESFMEKLDGGIHQLLAQVTPDFMGCYHRAKPQEDYAKEGEKREGEYWKCPKEKDWTVTPDMSPEQIDRIFRAFYGYECLFLHDAKKYELIKASVVNQKPAPGRFCFEIRNGYYITAEKVEKII